MRLTNKKHPFLSLFAWIFAIFIVVPGGLGYSGFCWSEKWWLSEEELIQPIVSKIITNDFVHMRLEDEGGRYPQIKKYKNVEDFLERNPNCCKADRRLKGDYWPPTFWDRATGYWGYPVEIKGTLYYKDDHGNEKTETIKIQQVLNNCGQHPHLQ